MTDAERRLWSAVRRRQLGGHFFRRQEPIGKYIVDFVCKKQRIVVELDGGRHAMRIAQDEKRTEFLKEQGYRVLRFWNNEVLENIDGVLETILSNLDMK